MTKREELFYQSKEIVLEFKSNREYLENIHNFKTSYYKSIYQMAFRQLDDIIEEHTGKRKDSNGNCPYLNDVQRQRDSNSELSNILSFVGRRGSGKTSVMISFMEALKDYFRESKICSNNNDIYKFKSTNEVMFTCLECIDGALLEKGEDIFKIVLAQMYQKFIDLDFHDEIRRDEGYDQRKRELLKRIEDIYRTVCDIETMEKNAAWSGDSYMTTLQSLSSSQKVKKEFRRLIKQFVEMMRYRQTAWCEQHYVIITIDDIDLNIDNGFSMLEKIHRYLMVPNVIVLLSLDMEQITALAVRHFYEIIPKVDNVLKDKKEYVYNLALQYIDKVLPLNYRIYMPDLSDRYQSHFWQVKKENAEIKRSILGKIFRRTAVRFDSQGLKRHFYEPDSMRELNNFYLFLDRLEHVKYYDLFIGNKDSEAALDAVKIYDENTHMFLADLLYRIALEKLKDSVELRFFQGLMNQDILRAMESTLQFCKEHLKDYSMPQKRINYGQLIEAMHILGRDETEKYKPLVHCLLAYFSYAMTRTYIYETLEIKDKWEKDVVQKGTFKNILGTGILDQWNDDLLPDFIMKPADQVGLSESDNPQSDVLIKKDSPLKLEKILMINAFNIKIDFLPDKGAVNVDTYTLYRKIAQLVQNIEIMAMLFTDVKNDSAAANSKYDWSFKIVTDSQGDTRIQLVDKKDKGNEDISTTGSLSFLNFVITALDASELLEKIEKNLVECFVGELEELLNKEQIWKTEFEDVLKSYSLKERYRVWSGTAGRALPLPVYWFDFMYNVLKRTKRNVTAQNPELATEENLYDYVCVLYETIAEQMNVQQDFYNTKKKEKDDDKDTKQDDDKNSKTELIYDASEIFKTCPVVEYFKRPASGNAQDAQKAHDNELIETKKAFFKEFIERSLSKDKLFG